MHRKEMTIKRNFQKLRESPGVRYESVGRGFESLPSHQERPEHNVFWSFFFCAWKGLEQHGRAAGEANNSPVGCCLVRGDHRPGMSAVEPELCSGLSFFCAWKGLEQHGRAAGEANNSPVGCCLVRGDHRPGMSAVEPELCSGLSFLCVEGTRTARPSRRRGKQQPGGLLFSARGLPSGNVCRGSCGSKDFMAFCFVSHGCTVFARLVFSMSDYVGRCIALQ